MDTIKVLKKSIRDYKLPSILTPIFIIGEVVLETLIPTVMAVLIDEISKSISMDPIIKYGLILLAMALASLLCGFALMSFSCSENQEIKKALALHDADTLPRFKPIVLRFMRRHCRLLSILCFLSCFFKQCSHYTLLFR